jgi:hypothetical protein
VFRNLDRIMRMWTNARNEQVRLDIQGLCID